MTKAEAAEKGRAARDARLWDKRVLLWRQLVRGEPLKRAAWNVGVSYTTAKRYRREA